MTFYKNITNMEIENSSLCNAACPACAREQTPGDYSWLTEKYLSVEFFDRIPTDILLGLKKLLFTGTIGDPCTAPNFVEIIKSIRHRAPNLFISVSTNGGMKSPEWWTSLAQALGQNSEVTFAIDGLEDTNDIYRVNVRWNKVMANTTAFITTGGQARWQYIVFKHNEHQVDTARQLANSMGFKSFVMRPSHRFKVDEFLGIESRFGKNGIQILPPTDPQFVHKVMVVKKEDYVRPGSTEWYAASNDSKINCYVKEAGSVYIDYQGRILPCCFLSGGVFVRRTNKYPDGWDVIWNTYGDTLIDLHNYAWEEILASEFFKQIEASWTESYANGRLLTCAGTCSEFKSRLNDPEEFCNEETTHFDQ